MVKIEIEYCSYNAEEVKLIEEISKLIENRLRDSSRKEISADIVYKIGPA